MNKCCQKKSIFSVFHFFNLKTKFKENPTIVQKMSLIINFQDFNTDFVHYAEKVRNKVLSNSSHDVFFVRLLYSTSYFVMNGIFLKLDKHHYTVEDKYKKNIYISFSDEFKQIIKQIEHNIITSYVGTNKINCNYDIFNFVSTPKINIQLPNNQTNQTNNNSNNSFDLYFKISGLWFDKNTAGLTHKLVYF